MSDRTILFATDFSPAAEQALTYATRLARAFEASLVVLHVAEPIPMYATGDLNYGFAEPDMGELRRELQRIVPDDPAVQYEHRLVCGTATDTILRMARDIKPDFIVLATHGRRGISRALMGSVAETVLRLAPCPVVTVKAASEAPLVDCKQFA